MKENSCYFVNEAERKKLEQHVINLEKGAVNAAIVGKSAFEIAQGAGIKVPENTKILLAHIEGVGPEFPLSREKLSPVLAYFTVKDDHEGVALAREMVYFGGMGHSAVIHCQDEAIIEEFATTMPVGRVIINQPSSQLSLIHI